VVELRVDFCAHWSKNCGKRARGHAKELFLDQRAQKNAARLPLFLT